MLYAHLSLKKLTRLLFNGSPHNGLNYSFNDQHQSTKADCPAPVAEHQLLVLTQGELPFFYSLTALYKIAAA